MQGHNDTDDTFFVASSSDSSSEVHHDDVDGGAKTMSSHRGAPLRPDYSPFRATPSMEDILYALPPPPTQRRPNIMPIPVDISDSSERGDAEPTAISGSPALQHFAGGSPVAMPAFRVAPSPRPLVDLRGMTSAEVREELEKTFVANEAANARFRRAEATLKDTPGSTVEHDRCRRLVNVCNWGAANGEESPLDVLLPSCLVPMEPSSAANATTSQRTLRKHQIEGIRFMWSLLVEGPVGLVPAVGCILAHTMGLGKTAQVVVFLHVFMAAFSQPAERRGAAAPLLGLASSPTPPKPRVLIVVPKSTQPGWMREFQLWASCFPPGHQLTPRAIEENTKGSQRLTLFYDWRRRGGILVIGYEALVRLMQLVEEDNLLKLTSSSENAQQRQPLNGSSSSSRDAHYAELRERRVDEGAMAYGGPADPFTELVVCDEAHRLKSVHLRIVRALRGLHPLRRLLLTGTPLQNHLQEYWAMMDFGVHKYFSQKRFREYFIQPIEASVTTAASQREVDAARKKTFTLISEVRHFVQRVDSTPLKAELPPLHEYIVVVPLSPLQTELYLRFIRLVQREGGQRFQFLPAVSYSGKIAAHPQLLYNLRETEQHPSSRTAAPANRGRGGGIGNSAEKLPPQRRPVAAAPSAVSIDPTASNGGSQKVIHEAEEGGDGDEAEEDDTSNEGEEEDPVSFASHYSLSKIYPTITYSDLFVPPAADYQPCIEDGTKLYVALKLIEAAVRQGEKVLFFSLSTQLLSFFETLIAEANKTWVKGGHLKQPLRYCRLDGSHTAAQRSAMLEDFDREEGPDLFLLSMKAGGVGITITAATRVILVDTSFNPADDQQAIGRAYRYGQTRPVYVYRLLCHSTLEYSIFIQKLAKEWLFKTVVEESSIKRDGLAGMRLRELFTLLDKAAKVLVRGPSITAVQHQSTTEVMEEDTLLQHAKDHLLYAQRYELFLEQDQTDQYGDEEEAFYQHYRRHRPFDTSEDDGPEQRAAEMERRRRQRTEESGQLQLQAKTLTSMVDEIIRSRSSTDPHLARLLSAMGLQVNRQTGTVHQTSSTPHSSVVGSPVSHVSASKPSAPPSIPANRPAVVLLLDSDDEGDGVVPQSNADQIAASLAQQPYAAFQPGSTRGNAVEVDSQESP